MANMAYIVLKYNLSKIEETFPCYQTQKTWTTVKKIRNITKTERVVTKISAETQ